MEIFSQMIPKTFEKFIKGAHYLALHSTDKEPVSENALLKTLELKMKYKDKSRGILV